MSASATIADHLRRLADWLSPPPRPAWIALPGGQIELGDTGYRIVLRATDKGADVVLFTPEGCPSWKGREDLLDDLKRKAEECARTRAEFAAIEIDKAARGEPKRRRQL